MIPKSLVKRVKVSEIGARVETIQTTALLRLTRILRRILETCCHSDFSKKKTISYRWCEKIARSNKNINTKKEWELPNQSFTSSILMTCWIQTHHLYSTCLEYKYQCINRVLHNSSLMYRRHFEYELTSKIDNMNLWVANPGNGVAPSPTPWCSSYRKGSLRVILDYGR